MPTLLSDDEAVQNPPADGADDSDPDEPVRWMTVATFWTPPAAHLARLKLESEEIDCQIANENIVAADFLLAPAVGGIRVLVPDFEIERARALLAELPEPVAEVTRVAFGACPECGSENVDRPVVQTKTFWAGCIALMMMGSVVMMPLGLGGFAYWLLMWRPWRCRDCGNTFRRGEEGPRGFPMAESLRPSPVAEE